MPHRLAILLLAAIAHSIEGTQDGCQPADNLGHGHTGNPVIVLNNVTAAPNSPCPIFASASLAGTTRLRDFTHGLRLVEAFLGSWSPCAAFVLLRQGNDVEYAGVLGNVSAFSTDNVVTEAKSQTQTNSGHAMMVTTGQLPTLQRRDTCPCPAVKNHRMYVKGGIYSSSESWHFDQAVHEFTHVFQSLHAYTFTWAIEGGADHVTCMLISEKNTTSDGGNGNQRGYQDCIVSWLTESWPFWNRSAPADGMTILEKYAATYAGATAYDTDYSLSPGSAFHPVLYSGGLAATVFAINRSGHSSQDYWTGVHSPWINNNVTADIGSVDYTNWYPNTIPDSLGWRKSFLAFTGDASMTEFFAAFDAWYRSLPNPSTNYNNFATAVKAVLEQDASIVSQGAVTYASQSRVNLANLDSVFPGDSCAAGPNNVASSAAASSVRTGTAFCGVFLSFSFPAVLVAAAVLFVQCGAQ